MENVPYKIKSMQKKIHALEAENKRLRGGATADNATSHLTTLVQSFHTANSCLTPTEQAQALVKAFPNAFNKARSAKAIPKSPAQVQYEANAGLREEISLKIAEKMQLKGHKTSSLHGTAVPTDDFNLAVIDEIEKSLQK